MKSTTREGSIQGRLYRNTSGNSFTIGTFSRVFHFSLTFTAHANIAHPPCWTNLFSFIIETTLRVIPVLVPLNLKVGPVGGEKFYFLFTTVYTSSIFG